jgi:RNA polymerase sigma factor (sigma-70 family)
MDHFSEPSDPALAGLGQDALLERARQGDRRATNALAMQYYEAIGARVAYLARQAGLQEADAKDALEEVLAAVLRAIPHYQPARAGVPRPCSLGTHLRQVATRRFQDYLRHGSRARRRDRVVWEAAARAAQPSAAPGAADWLCPPAEWKDEPCLAAQRQEALAALPAALRELGETERRLGEGVLGGTPQGELARQLGLAACARDRLWHKVLGVLRGRLKKY